MIEILLGSLLGVWGFTEAVDTKPPPPGTVNLSQSQQPNLSFRESVTLEPMSQLQFRNVIRQAYDYSCGSAALTSLLDYFLGRNLQERQVMEGLLQFVEDPALGNISFTRTRFEEIWDQNVLFVIFPNGNEPPNALALSEQDLRIIDDRTVSLLAFREFPQMTKFTENQATELGSDGDIRYIRRK